MLTGTLDAVSNKATWEQGYQLIDSETDEPIDISAATSIVLAIRDMQSNQIVLSARLGTGIVLTTDGTDGEFTWRFESAQMRSLCAKTYEVGCVITNEGDDTQLIIGRVPVVDGIVQ